MAFPLCGGNVRRQGEPALPTNTPEEPEIIRIIYIEQQDAEDDIFRVEREL